MVQRQGRRRAVSDVDYARLLTVRTGLRRFERWSAEQAAAAGLTPSQHQLLLAVRGHQDPAGPTIRDISDYLLIRPHSAVELVDRTEQAGLVRRRRDQQDHRVVRLRTTARAEEILADLANAHLEELARLVPLFHGLLDELG
ncbi:MAG TPA: MarR family winged helix-turn-helix transcriptional regulator [Jatrophihabitans sp.]|nr:MarR family winged helix-turn-helix transcriptional regulator [Jatrophihabitans sp.]